MKVGIIVYSYTNNTLRIAEKLAVSLIHRGYDAEVLSIKAQNENPNATQYHLVNIPNIEKYDAVVFASCVRAFDCAPIFKQYLQTLQPIKHKKVAGFVSQFLPFDFMGGSQALNTMENLVTLKEAELYKLACIHVKFYSLDKQIKNMSEQCALWLEA